ncbi:MAG: pyrroline-5-carboxylate reductase [Fibromonadaceae bacterium]|jgi:pyrroline-5-carboxylate reductase|nr:pyrroline-5-carboxylate reductase [Fibromonadaceae bacterium]
MLSAKKIFFIGAGNIGGAILRALTENGHPPEAVFFHEPNEELANKVAEASKAQKVFSIEEGISKADLVFLCVKPQVFREISKELQVFKAFEDLTENTHNFLVPRTPIIVSVMAGISIAALREAFPNKSIVRTMPNIAITTKSGTVAIATDGVEEDVLQMVESLFSACADTFRVFESQMDAVTGLSGSGPAFVFQFAEALAMGGVKTGLPRDTAMKLALSTLIGSTQMLKKSKLCPGELTASVCSPAGTTITGLQELENKAFRGIVMAAVEAAAKRSVELGK